MQDRDIRIDEVEFEDIPEELLNNIVYALEEGKKILESATHGQSFAPFTAIVDGKNVLLEAHTSEDADGSFKKAQKKVKKTKDAKSYAFCYDGFVETEDGEQDAIISEGGLAGETKGFAISMPYTKNGSDAGGTVKYSFDAGMVFLGEAPNFFTE